MFWIIKKKITDKWFWFIESSDGEQLFFHASTMEGGYPEFEEVQEWTQVEFEIWTGKDWRPQASSVRIVEWSSQEDFKMAA